MANFHDVTCPACRRGISIPAYQVNTTVAECGHCQEALHPGLRRAAAAATVAQSSVATISPATKYGAVRAPCLCHNIVGSLFALVGVLALLASVGEVFNPAGPKAAASSHTMTAAIEIGAGAGLLMAGLLQLAAAQVLRIFMDQEEHQQVMREMLRQLLGRA